MKSVKTIALLVFTVCAVTLIAVAQDAVIPGSVNDVMLTIVTPATNTIWGIEDPQSDEEWQVYVDAAAQLIDAATRIKAGGAGTNDSAWAENPEWQRYADILIESGNDIQAAARDR